MAYQASPPRGRLERHPAAPLATLENIAHRLGGTWVLRGLSLELAAGEAVAVIGANGTGKTTLLRVLATLYTPTRGDGRVLDHDLRRDPSEVRSVVGLLAASPGNYLDLTAAENLAFTLRMLGESPVREVIDGALAHVGLLPFAGRRVRDFSSGMQRRLSIARVMLRAPKVLLADEPYSNLDTDGATLVDELIRVTTERGGAALVVLHDEERAHRLDRVVELREGRLWPASPPRAFEFTAAAAESR